MSCGFAFANSKDRIGKLAPSPRSNLEGSPKVIISLTGLIAEIKSKKGGKSNVQEEENIYDLTPMEVKKEEE